MRQALIPATFATLALMAGTAVAQDNTGKRITAALEGEQQTAGGDLDGTGTATIRINPGLGQVCYNIRVSGIAPATLAHIHEGAAGTNGPVRVDFMAPTSGSSSGCVDVGKELALEILREPENYYVNVHNADFPSGALRGQLAF